MAARTGSAEWRGDLKGGAGTVKVGDGVFEGTYSFASRFEEGEGTNPEELIAGAHAACYSMALSGMLASDGHVPDSVTTTAKVHLRNIDGAPTIARIDLETDGVVSRNRRGAVPVLRGPGEGRVSRLACARGRPRDRRHRPARVGPDRHSAVSASP